MTRYISGALIAVSAAVLASCSPSRQSDADTTASSSSTIPTVIPAVGAAVGNSTSNGAAAPESNIAGAQQTNATATHSTTNVRSAASDSGIIGRDSVVRRRVRGLPTASSSTPIRR